MDAKRLSVLKGRLTKAKKAGPLETVAECKAALLEFEVSGYPDCWSTWQIEKEFAEMKLGLI